MSMSSTPRGRMDIVDLNSVQILWILRRMRDDGVYLDGRSIKFPPKYFLGAAASPFASEPRFQALREHKKVNAGAQFFQTNLVYDIDRMETWLEALAKRNILDKVYILVGITPIKSLKVATYMNNEVPGVFVPEKLLKRMEAAGDKAEEEGVQIALELIEKVKGLQGIHGIHLMAVGWEEIVPRIVTEAGILPPDFQPPRQKPSPPKSLHPEARCICLTSLRRLIQAKTGNDIRRCMGCELCSNVISADQDLPLYSLIQLILLDDEEVLTCRTVWSDQILAGARSACLHEFNMQEILLALREEALRRGLV